jgi:hypothetical protein
MSTSTHSVRRCNCETGSCRGGCGEVTTNELSRVRMLHGGTKFGSIVKTTHINYDGWLRLHVMTVFARSKILYEVSRCQSSVFASTQQFGLAEA